MNRAEFNELVRAGVFLRNLLQLYCIHILASSLSCYLGFGPQHAMYFLPRCERLKTTALAHIFLGHGLPQSAEAVCSL